MSNSIHDSAPQTLVSSAGDSGEDDRDRLILVALGSPERNFNNGGSTYPLDRVNRVRFGRSGTPTWDHGERNGRLEIAIPLPWVSGVHAELHLEGPGLRLVDQGSRNGTLIDGVPIPTRAMLHVGQPFEVGRSFWLIRRVRRNPDTAEATIGPRFANPQARAQQRAIARLAPSHVPIVLSGETGTGKERLARAIHVRSERKGPFVGVQLAAGSIERLLFDGHRFRAATGGTLFLDDVGELPAEEQTKLTSALMTYAPNSGFPTQGDLAEPRVISSTSRDLRSMVELGTFRPDLMARLAGYEAHLPPLRIRPEDLGLLAMDVLRRHARGGPTPRISTDVFRAMLRHDWPFNLRELEHTLATARTLVDQSDTATQSDLSNPDPGVIDNEVWGRATWTVEGGDPSPTRIEAVRRELVQQLALHRGELSAVASALDCDLAEVERWTHRLSLRPDRYRESV